MRVVIDLSENYDDALSLTAIGSDGIAVNISNKVVDLNKHNHIIIRDDGIAEVLNDAEQSG